jgi:hypothetical protein
MRKFILAALLMLTMSISTTAQTKAITLNGSHSTTDTITDAGTTNLTSPLIGNQSGKVAISLKTTNVSGTSTFKAVLQGSINGTDWNNIHGVAGTNGINCDTLQVTSAAPAVWIFNVAPGAVKSVTDSTVLYTKASRYFYYRVSCIGTGTHSTIVSGQILPYND